MDISDYDMVSIQRLLPAETTDLAMNVAHQKDKDNRDCTLQAQVHTASTM
jgi:hypothetical protein